MIMNIKKIIHNNIEAKNAGWLIGGKIAQMLLSFLISIFTARYLGPSNYGIINYAGAYVAFFTSLCTLGINSIIIKEFIDHPEDEGTAIGTSIILRIGSSVFSSIMIIGIVWLLDGENKQTIVVSALCSLSLVFQVFDTINYWFQSRYESKITALATLVAYISTSIYKIILLIQHKGVEWFAFASSIDFICIAAFLLLSYKKHGGPKLRFSWTKGKTLLSRSYHYILSGMMVAIYGQTDKLMLKQMLDETTVGYYSLASTVNNTWVFVLVAIIDSIYPTILQLYSQHQIEAYERKNRQLYAIVIYISIFVAVVFIIFGKTVIVLMYGKEYEPSAEPLKIICWYTIFSFLGVARNAWIVCENKQKYLKYMYLSAAIINVLLNLIFIPRYGASGAAFASLLTQIMTSIVLPCAIKEMRPNVRLMLNAFLLRGIR